MSFPKRFHMDGMVEKLAEGKFKPFNFFRSDLAAAGFSKSYVFIEPDWHPFTTSKEGIRSIPWTT